jgi:hypothetical protein
MVLMTVVQKAESLGNAKAAQMVDKSVELKVLV